MARPVYIGDTVLWPAEQITGERRTVPRQPSFDLRSRHRQLSSQSGDGQTQNLFDNE